MRRSSSSPKTFDRLVRAHLELAKVPLLVRQGGVLMLLVFLALVGIFVTPSGAVPMVGAVHVYDVKVIGAVSGTDGGKSASASWTETYKAFRVKVTPTPGYGRVKASVAVQGTGRGDAVVSVSYRDGNPAFPCVWTKTYREPRLLSVRGLAEPGHPRITEVAPITPQLPPT